MQTYNGPQFIPVDGYGEVKVFIRYIGNVTEVKNMHVMVYQALRDAIRNRSYHVRTYIEIQKIKITPHFTTFIPAY